MTPEAGLSITPTVRLIQPLGSGGMGSVWLAEHRALRTTVVVKFMASTLATDPQAVARFAQEASVAAQVRSPHVVTMLDHGTFGGVPYIVMEHLAGEDLAMRLARGPLAPATVVTIVEQLAVALARVHERGILHRDIKPANVFLCSDTGRDIFVKLLDFGIAKSTERELADASTRTGTLVGTPFYMSPEQLAGKKTLDPRADLWAVGILAFEALTGTRPYRADSIGELVLLVHSSAPPRPSVLAPGLPPAVDAWFARACAREPEERFGSAPELARALAGALAGVAPVRVSGPSLPEPATTLVATEGALSVETRPPRRGLLVAAAVATVLVAGGLATRRFVRPAPPAAVPVASTVAPAPPVVSSPAMSSAPPPVSLPPVETSAARPKRRPRPAPSASGRRPQFEDIE